MDGEISWESEWVTVFSLNFKFCTKVASSTRMISVLRFLKKVCLIVAQLAKNANVTDTVRFGGWVEFTETRGVAH